MLYDILEESKKNNKLISLLLYGDVGFWCGVVQDYNQEFIELKHYTKYGDVDGLAIERISDIERIDIQDKHLKAMTVLIEKNDQLRKMELKSRMFDDLNEENWQFISLKPYELDRGVLVSIQVNSDNFYQGFVMKLGLDFLKFEIIDEDGFSDGVCLFKLKDINSIKLNDFECRKRLLIYNKINESEQ